MKKIVPLRFLRRNGRAVECGGLENRCPPSGGPGVRIPFPPQQNLQQRPGPARVLNLRLAGTGHDLVPTSLKFK